MTKLDLISDVIYNAVSEVYPAEDPANDDVRKDVLSFIHHAQIGYVMISEDKAKYYMGDDWFEEEAIQHTIPDFIDRIVYFIPISRLLQD